VPIETATEGIVSACILGYSVELGNLLTYILTTTNPNDLERGVGAVVEYKLPKDEGSPAAEVWGRTRFAHKVSSKVGAHLVMHEGSRNQQS
jgi:hypothetical protein